MDSIFLSSVRFSPNTYPLWASRPHIFQHRNYIRISLYPAPPPPAHRRSHLFVVLHFHVSLSGAVFPWNLTLIFLRWSDTWIGFCYLHKPLPSSQLRLSPFAVQYPNERDNSTAQFIRCLAPEVVSLRLFRTFTSLRQSALLFWRWRKSVKYFHISDGADDPAMSRLSLTLC